jgi:hypothetical protein
MAEIINKKRIMEKLTRAIVAPVRDVQFLKEPGNFINKEVSS